MTQTVIKSLSYELDQILCDYADRVCVYKGDEKHVTYSELRILIENVIHILNHHQVCSGDTIVIRSRKCEFSYAAVLACLKYGAVFCLVDPNTPNRRLRDILRLTNTKLVLNGWGVEGFESDIEQVSLTSDLYQKHNFKEVAIFDQEIGPSRPAYIVFTSGSTGIPKGVTISRSSLLLFIDWAKRAYNLTCHDIHTHLNPIYFDNSIFDIFSTFYTGASLVPFTEAECKDPFQIVDKIQKYKCNIFFSVPSLLRFIVNLRAADDGQLMSLTKIIFGGEGYPISELTKLFDLTNEHAELHNVYGPSECTCICSTYKITKDDLIDGEGFPPIGKVTENFDFYILDEFLKPATDGVVGELYLGGPCVGLGYFNDLDRTNDKFIMYQDSYNFTNKIYGTGDLFRKSTVDQKLYFVGRKDFQIKKQGYRIELEEIENNAITHDFITDACCYYTEKTKRLTLVIEVIGSLTFNDVYLHMRQVVPNYMLPDEVKLLERMPKNSNGKTDRKGVETLCNELESLR